MPAIEIARPLIEARKHKLEIQLPSQDVWIMGDQVRLSQVVGNLLINAGKFTPVGGQISLRAQMNDTHVTIGVTDNGIGVAPDRVSHIFDLFAQAGCSPDRAQDGLGIGLSLVQQLVKLHGGKVEVASMGIGKGSRFDVVLPLLANESEAQYNKEAIQDRTRNAIRKVLIVDDNLDAAAMLSALIQSDGHECVVANDGRSALDATQRFKPEIVILDIGLPGMSGYELARAFRRDPTLHDVTLVALTGYGQIHDKQRAAEAGFHQHLVKPIDLARLAELGLATL